LTVTEERRENMAFTDSYIANEQVLVVPAADAAKYTDKASLKGVSIVAESGSAGESAIAADLPDAAYTAVDSQSKALLEVKAGTAAAAVIDATMASSMTGDGTDYADLVVITSLNLTAEEYAIGFRLDSTAVAEFNKVTGELLADGTLATIADKYGLADRLMTK
jgi:polar amino acid transport system substrate-binding protein